MPMYDIIRISDGELVSSGTITATDAELAKKGYKRVEQPANKPKRADWDATTESWIAKPKRNTWKTSEWLDKLNQNEWQMLFGMPDTGMTANVRALRFWLQLRPTINVRSRMMDDALDDLQTAGKLSAARRTIWQELIDA